MRLRKRVVVLSLMLAAMPTLADPCGAPLPAKGQRFSGEVTYIVDGAGLCVGRDRGGIEVRNRLGRSGVKLTALVANSDA